MTAGTALRTTRLCRLASLAAVAAASSAAAAGGAAAAPPGGVRQQPLVRIRGAPVSAVAATGPYLVWQLEGPEEHPASAVIERDRRTGKVRRLAVSTEPIFGMASTPTSVVFAAARGRRVELVAVRHGGSGRIVLSRSLIAPIASRGPRVAWAEQAGRDQQVIVRDMTTGRRWLAARIPGCVHGRCYRIDAVTLADDGVVFTRGARGPQPSLVVRRRFGAPRATAVAVPDDPQPDLAASSAGALYYRLGHGWMRWDFGRRRPSATSLAPGARAWVLAYEHGRLVLATGPRCDPRLVVRSAGGHSVVVPPPAAAGSGGGALCRQIMGVSWRGRRLLTAWALAREPSPGVHVEDVLERGGLVAEAAVP